MPSPPRDQELLTVAEVAAELGLEPVTVYRWCRRGHLPSLKLGREWRIRRTALEAFLRRAEQHASLVGQLRAFYTVPDHVIALGETMALLHHLNAAFFQVGEAYDGLLAKFLAADAPPPEQTRAALAAHGLGVAQLESAGRLRFVVGANSVRELIGAIRELQAEARDQGRSLWIAINWLRQVPMDEAVRQQEALRQLVEASQLVIQTTLLESDMGTWSFDLQRQVEHLHLGAIWISAADLLLARIVPRPSA